MEIKVPKGATLVSSPFLNVDFKFSPTLEQKLNDFYGIGGALQTFADSEFMNTIKPYMPFKTNVLINSMIQNTVLGSGMNIVKTPYARYLYYGMLMLYEKIDPETGKVTRSAFAPKGGKKVETDTPLEYHGGSKTGAKWDEQWKANNLVTYIKSLQDFADNGGV